jgi:hypothetical protein
VVTRSIDADLFRRHLGSEQPLKRFRFQIMFSPGFLGSAQRLILNIATMLSSMAFEVASIGSLIVRNVDDELISRLKLRAARNRRSAEAEHREILRQALSGKP